MDIIEIAADFLQIDQSLVNQFMQEGTVQAIFFLFFFPSVFLITFVYILVTKKSTGRKDLDLLISVAIYAFILMSGYFTWFVFLSKWWLYLLLFLGAWYVIMHHGGGGDGGGSPGSGGRTVGGGIRNQVSLKKRKDEIYRDIDELRRMVHDANKASGGVIDMSIKSFAEAIEQKINQYENDSIASKVTNVFGGKNEADKMRETLSRARAGH